MTDQPPLISGFINTPEEEKGDYDDELGPPSDELTWDFGLTPAGDAGSSFRTQNDPRSPYQRSNYIERKGTIDIRCSCLDVIHGTLLEDGDTLATLIVPEFRFDARKRTRRVKSVEISLEFRALDTASETTPEVFAIAPEGSFGIAPTTQHEEIKRSTSGQLGATAPVGGLTVTGSMGWERTVSRDSTDQCRVVGSRDLMGRNWGAANTASWTLLENSSTKSGVPALLRTAILLRRRYDDAPFQCVIKLAAEVDLHSKLERLWGGKGRGARDDPVLFDPRLDPTNCLQQYDVYNLGQVDLEGLCRVSLPQQWRDNSK